MSWEGIHRCLLHPSESVMKEMCHHQTLTRLPKHCPNKLNQAPCKICYTLNMKTFSKGTTVDTNNLQPGELINIYFDVYNVSYIRGLNFILTVVYSKTIMI